MPAHSQSSDNKYLQQRGDLLESGAAGDRAQIEKIRKQADQYRELAQSADLYAQQASDVKARADWQETARKHRASAEKLDAEAAALDHQAGTAQSEATDLRNQVESNNAAEAQRKAEYDKKASEIAARDAAAQKARDENKNKCIKVGSALGLWRMEGSGDPFVIVQKDPQSKAYPHVLQAHTVKRVWDGEFHYQPPPGEPLMTFSYKPKAEEMNPEIPGWARSKIEGDLEWKLEITNTGTCGTPVFEASFYPGEVKWKEGGWLSKKVSVSGKGDARKIVMKASLFDMAFYSYGAPQLYLRPEGIRREKKAAAGTGQTATVRKVEGRAAATPAPVEDNPDNFNEDLETVDGLVKGQRFNIDVILPPEMAEKQGETLRVDIKASGGSATTVELRRGALRKGRSVVYTRPEAITIADPHDVTEEDLDPPLLSMNYILGYQGQRIDLKIKNGELVTFSFDEALQTIPVFNSWVQRSINQHQEAAARLRNIFTLILADPKKSAAPKAQATKRMAMIKNYETIMESDKIHDFIRMKVGDAYFSETFGLIGMTEQQWQAEVENLSPFRGGSPHPLSDYDRDGGKNRTGVYKGVVWIHRDEMARIENTVTDARIEYRETALSELPVAITFAMYETVAGLSNAGDVFTLASGQDIFGKPASGMQRLMSAINLVNAGAMMIAMPHIMTPPDMKAMLHTNNPLQLSGRALRSGARMRLKQQRIMMDPALHARVETAVKGLNPTQRASIMPASEPDGLGMGPAPERASSSAAADEPLDCGVMAQKSTGSAGAGGGDDIMARRPDDVKRWYNENTEYARPGNKLAYKPQEHPTCGVSFSRKARAEAGLDPGTELGDLGFMTTRGIVEPGTNQPLVNGYTQQQTIAFLEAQGAKVMVFPTDGVNRPLTLEAMDAWLKRGWHIRDVISPHAEGHARHSVDLEEFPRNAQNQIEDVVWHDPGAGDSLKTPACDYLNEFATSDHDIILYRWTGDGEGSVIAPENSFKANRSTGSAMEGAPETPKPAETEYQNTGYMQDAPEEKIDPNTIQRIGDNGKAITMSDELRMARSVKRLDTRLDELFPGSRKPALNVISHENMKKIYASRTWLPPAAGGASFSREGSDVAGRYEAVAISVRPEHEHFISWEKTEHGTGQTPKFWESGVIGEGKSTDYIPAEHLQWIDGDQKAWVPFTERKLETTEAGDLSDLGGD